LPPAVQFKKKMRLPQNRRSGFSAESRTLQFAGEMRRSADRRYKMRNIEILSSLPGLW
jgi:hypothetical protein